MLTSFIATSTVDFNQGWDGVQAQNLLASDSLGFAPVEGTPAPAHNSIVCQDDKAVEWLFVPASHGTEYVQSFFV